MEAFRLQSLESKGSHRNTSYGAGISQGGRKVWTQLLMGPQMWLVFLPTSPNPSAGCLPPSQASGCCREIVLAVDPPRLGRVDVRWRDLVSLQHQGEGGRSHLNLEQEAPPRRLAFTPGLMDSPSPAFICYQFPQWIQQATGLTLFSCCHFSSTFQLHKYLHFK